ncbi:unnamed protein product, partial [Mesorhabditis belari]|uniref:Zinc carboxypeptidase A 1 n=1 Tax=Mesorhabditis belari TaxID=2138241 RepID=A0AAF3ED89_9BILA
MKSLFFLVIIHSLYGNIQAKKFSVLRISPSTRADVEFLQEIRTKDHDLDFWKGPTEVNREVHLMVDEAQKAYIERTLERHNINHTIMIPDVERVIVEQKKKRAKLNSELRLRDWRDGKINFNLAQYHSFADVINYLNALAVTYPELVSVQPIGTTHEGRQIPLIKVTNKRLQSGNKKAVWVDGGIHAREWVSPSTVLYFIHTLITQYDKDPKIRQYVDSMDWYLVPLLNPDGYEYSRSSTNPEIRLWRKNRSPTKCIQVASGPFTPPQQQCCQGVDLNRNFDWFFGQVGSSTDPCSEIYQGGFAFSEPETRAVRDFLAQHRITTFITLHSYSQILMYPFGHQVRTYSNDLNDLHATATNAANALRSMYGTQYRVGTGADTLYPASGGSEDWAKGKAHVKYSYLFELRPEEQVWDGFLLAENQILPTARETWEAVKVIADQSLRLQDSNTAVRHQQPQKAQPFRNVCEVG